MLHVYLKEEDYGNNITNQRCKKSDIIYWLLQKHASKSVQLHTDSAGIAHSTSNQRLAGAALAGCFRWARGKMQGTRLRHRKKTQKRNKIAVCPCRARRRIELYERLRKMRYMLRISAAIPCARLLAIMLGNRAYRLRCWWIFSIIRPMKLPNAIWGFRRMNATAYSCK